MNTDLLLRVQQIDPAPPDDSIPDGVWDAQQVLEQLQRRTGDSVPQRSRTYRGWLIAAAAAVVVLVLIGGLVVLTGDQSTDAPPVITQPEPIPTTVPESPTTTLAADGSPDQPTIGEFDFDYPGLDASVVDYFSAVMESATVITEDPLVLQPVQGPEPQFDTSLLGLEIPLLPAMPGDRVVIRGERPGIDWTDHPDASTPLEPFIHVGRIDAPFTVEFLVFSMEDDTFSLCEMFIEQGGGCGSPRVLDSDHPMQTDSGLPGYVHAFVPLETAVVRLVIDGGQPMWQRPIGRWALFPGRLTATTGYTLEIFNAAGAIIDVDSRTGGPVPSGTTSELLEEALQRDTVSNWYGGEDTKDELQYIAAYLANETPWPEPIFDTTGLGVEHPLTAIDSAALTSLPSYADNNFEQVVRHPFLAAAQLQGTSHAAAFRIDIGFADDSVTPNWSLVYSEDSDFSMGAPLAFAQFDILMDPELPNIILTIGGHHPDSPLVVIGGLPPDASVVTTTFGDGTMVWQRPVSGIAMLLDPNMRCFVATDDTWCEAEYLVLDADGNELLRIALPGTEPFGFSVTSP